MSHRPLNITPEQDRANWVTTGRLIEETMLGAKRVIAQREQANGPNTIALYVGLNGLLRTMCRRMPELTAPTFLAAVAATVVWLTDKFLPEQFGISQTLARARMQAEIELRWRNREP